MWTVLGVVLVLSGIGKCTVEKVTIGLGDELLLETPGFPHNAPATWQKTWHITSPPTTKITFYCYDVRLIQNHPPNCSEDVMLVDDGDKEIEYCGAHYDLQVVSVKNELKVQIRKGSEEGGGAQCWARLPLPSTTASPDIFEEFSWELEAGGPHKTIYSLNYPAPPLPHLTQTWRLTTDPNSRIRITCFDIRTVQNGPGECIDVTLSVSDSEKEEILCGQHSGFTMLSSGPEMSVEFKSGKHAGGFVRCEVRGRVMDWYGEATPPPPSTVPPYLGIPSEEVDSAEHGGPPGPKTTTCPCGWTNKESQRIVNGRETKVNEYPWVVAIADAIRKYQFCGGSLITPYHALTAAHCTVSFVNSGNPIAIVVGDHNLYIDEESNATETIDVERIIQHPGYKNYAVGEDISLLLLAKKVEFNKFVGPVCLSPTQLSLARQYVKVIGWGRLAWGGQSSDTLQKVDVRVIHPETCSKMYSSVSLEKRVQICTYSHQKAPCQGDSGGPVVWLDPETNRYILVGLVSFGTVCANEDPSVHTDVSAYYDWIQENIKETMPQDTCMKA